MLVKKFIIDNSTKMNKKRLLEFIPLVLFVLAGICSLLKLPFAGLVTVLTGLFVAMLYFYASFWLFAQYQISIVSKIAAGLAYSTTVIACIFCMQKFPNGRLFGIIGYILLAVIVITCLLNYKSGAYKPLLYRCFLFAGLLSLVFAYRFLLV